MKGLVIEADSSLYTIEADGVFYRLAPRGIFRKQNIHVIAGDYVDFDDENLVINFVYERKSSLKRPNIANIDQIVIVMSLKEPDFSPYLLLKYLTYANYNEVTAKVILTKNDLADEKNLAEADSLLDSLHIEHFAVSNKSGDGMDKLPNLFSGQITVLVGQTGVGKSSLLNSLNPDFNREIGEYSYALNRGKHKTTSTTLLPFLGGYIADTPGFSSLELRMNENELAKYFPSFSPAYLSCYYADCKHVSEPSCEVKKQVSEGIIPQQVYDIYMRMREDINEGIF
ncbi:MAG: ribosome small subunit-dependent GTPase A [Coprobacillus sp.]|nr:ribosome small subunit-dependent GTPase A [Coprobacillus sp.]